MIQSVFDVLESARNELGPGKRIALKKDQLPTGVFKNGDRFKAQIGISGKTRCIGNFSTVDEASIAYESVAKERVDVGAAKDDEEFDARFKSAQTKAIAAAAQASSTSLGQLTSDVAVGPKRKAGSDVSERSKKENGWGWKAGGLPTGITYAGTSKFDADISENNKKRHIGSFEKLEEAVAAYQFVEEALEDSGFPPSDDGRITVFEKAKERVRNASTNIAVSDA